jgi:hypothetical protein
MLAASALAALCSGCPTFSEPYLYREGFEGPYCDGTPCGWTQVAGLPGSARIGEILPGERALVIEGNGVAVRVEPAVGLPDVGDSILVLDLLARCDVGSSLSVEIGATVSFDGTIASYEPPLTAGNVLTDWSQGRPRAVAFPAIGRVLASIDSITVAKSGDGVCEIASIGVFFDPFAAR